MQFCQPHWAALKKAIADRGLDHLQVHSGVEAAKLTESQMKGGLTRENFEPLLAAHNMIVANALDAVGISLMRLKPDGSDPCPICELKAEEWIDKAADGVKRYYDRHVLQLPDQPLDQPGAGG